MLQSAMVPHLTWFRFPLRALGFQSVRAYSLAQAQADWLAQARGYSSAQVQADWLAQARADWLAQVQVDSSAQVRADW